MKHNPYVGPRPYQSEEGERFFGREREAQELYWLIGAEPVVIFYAPSGAGKTSLLNAKVIPHLQERNIDVLPVTRVGGDVPLDVAAGDVPNIFTFSALMGLSRDFEMSAQALLDHTLLTYLQTYFQNDAQLRPVLLILDQFEELFTTHRDCWKDMGDFFVQVQEALQALPNLGVVFTLREDYLAELDPYLSLLAPAKPARFRMGLLDSEKAFLAVERPATLLGYRYAEGAVEKLVEDVSRIKVQRRDKDGMVREMEVPGPTVEPVQLQVVCYQMWEDLPEQPERVVSLDEVREHGDVSRALGSFYERVLKQCVTLDVTEKRLRYWFGEKLITSLGTRGFVLRQEHETEGLPNDTVDKLAQAHIIRGETRAGAHWYELIHDRLIDPIVESNRRWESQEVAKAGAIYAFTLEDDDLRGDFRELADLVRRLLQDLPELEIATYTLHDKDLEAVIGSPIQEEAVLRARTHIHFDGDTEAVIPVRSRGEVDQVIWELHQGLVKDAVANRNALLQIIIELGSWLFGSMQA